MSTIPAKRDRRKPKPDVNPEYLSLEDLSCLCSLHENTLRKLIDQGMPYYQVGKRKLVRVNEFHDFMQRFRCGITEKKSAKALLDEAERMMP
jgi:hypothetical protein